VTRTAKTNLHNLHIWPKLFNENVPKPTYLAFLGVFEGVFPSSNLHIRVLFNINDLQRKYVKYVKYVGKYVG
jgi:hypothetical protein